MQNYNIEFKDAMQLLVDGKWLKGNLFADGHFIKLDNHGRLVVIDANRYYHEEICPFIKSLSNNKFRIITVATLNELKN